MWSTAESRQQNYLWRNILKYFAYTVNYWFCCLVCKDRRFGDKPRSDLKAALWKTE